MIAYNKQQLNNQAIQEDAVTAFRRKAITAEEKQAIVNAYPTKGYAPHFAIRVGLFVLTVVIALCALGIAALCMMSGLDSEAALRSLLIVVGLAAYGGMEFYILRGHFHSGVDDALRWVSAGLLLAGIAPFEHDTEAAFLAVSCVLAALFTLRTADPLMAVVSFLSFLGSIFFSLHEDVTGQATLPFTGMILSAIVYGVMRYLHRKPACRYYKGVFPWVLTASLLTFYMAGNYAVVTTLTGNPYEDYTPAYAPLYWTFTALVPFVYIFLGIRFKDAILLRTGLGLVAAAVFTVRAYYHALPLEWALVIAGAVLVFISYMLIRYLKTPRHGFSDEPGEDASRFTKLQLESLIITQSIQAPAVPQDHFDFGGGSGGGGGAGGTF